MRTPDQLADLAAAILAEPKPLIIERCPSMTEALATGLESGLLPRSACRAIGLRWSDFERLNELGQYWAEEEPEVQSPKDAKRIQRVVLFARAVASAQAVMATTALGQIKDAAASDWRAAAWLLERVMADDYGKKPTTLAFQASTKPDGSSDQRVVIVLPDNERDPQCLPAPQGNPS